MNVFCFQLCFVSSFIPFPIRLFPHFVFFHISFLFFSFLAAELDSLRFLLSRSFLSPDDLVRTQANASSLVRGKVFAFLLILSSVGNASSSLSFLFSLSSSPIDSVRCFQISSFSFLPCTHFLSSFSIISNLSVDHLLS